MIRLLEGFPDSVLGVEAVGKVTEEDYANVLAPAVRAKRDAHGKVRLVYVLGEDFDGWTVGGLWEDARLGLGDRNAWEKIAIVTDREWLRHAVSALGWMVPGEVRLFDVGELDSARDWAST